MPKVFDRQFEGFYQPKRINEDVWFETFQVSLLWLANTDFGRDLLCINKDFPRITQISKNHITGDLGNGLKVSEFRVGAKYANVIRFRWNDFCSAMQWYQPVFGLMFFNTPVLTSRNRYTTTTVYPDPNVETTTVDGRVGQSNSAGSTNSWATMRNAAGSNSSDSEASAEPVYITSDTTSNTWRRIHRGIYLFNTSSITTSDDVSAAVFSIRCTAKADLLSITPNLNVYGSTPASNTALANTDYAQTGTTAYATAIAYASVSTAVYNDFTFNATGIANVDRSGITKLSMKNANYDVANSAPSWSSDTDSYFTCYYADQAGTTDDPKLTVTHALGAGVSTKSKLLILGVG